VAEAHMKIGELSERSGRTVRTLHFYEELGLLSPASRTKGGFRLYDENALVRVHWISRLQDLGFSLPEVKEFLREIHGNASAPAMMGDLHRFYALKLNETRQQIERLRALESELSASLTYLSTCLGCAPATGKHQCPSCSAPDHASLDAPALVAAVQAPPVTPG
jgi:MerR family copper efflux transcriptional regulator